MEIYAGPHLYYGVPGLAAIGEKVRECALRERERRGVRAWTKA